MLATSLRCSIIAYSGFSSPRDMFQPRLQACLRAVWSRPYGQASIERPIISAW